MFGRNYERVKYEEIKGDSPQKSQSERKREIFLRSLYSSEESSTPVPPPGESTASPVPFSPDDNMPSPQILHKDISSIRRKVSDPRADGSAPGTPPLGSLTPERSSSPAPSTLLRSKLSRLLRVDRSAPGTPTLGSLTPERSSSPAPSTLLRSKLSRLLRVDRSAPGTPTLGSLTPDRSSSPALSTPLLGRNPSRLLGVDRSSSSVPSAGDETPLLRFTANELSSPNDDAFTSHLRYLKKAMYRCI